MKKNLLPVLLIALLTAAALLCQGCSQADGSNTESREMLLHEAISREAEWTITKEVCIENHIISAAYSTDGRIALAVFEPAGNGKYNFSTSRNRNSDDIIISGAIIDGSWYDLIWFNGAQTEYAEVIYTINGQKNEALIFDTKDMDIIYHKNTAAEYSIDVCYYDSEGNKYE